MKLLAPAKINLGLRLLRRREDGYHDIETFFHTLAWGDEVILEAAGEVSLQVQPAEDALPGEVISRVSSDRSNLAWKAAEAVIRAADLPGLDIILEKRIPPGSGLGGGSSDAAAVLKGALKLYGKEIPAEEMMALALELGADVPFFLKGGCALAEGVGEKLTPVDRVDGMPLLLILHPFQVSTEWAYGAAKYTLTRPACFSDYLSSRGGIKEILSSEELNNDLQEAVLEAHPEIAGSLTALKGSGAFFASMTGSGSAVYGLFDSDEDMAAAATALAAQGYITVETSLR